MRNPSPILRGQNFNPCIAPCDHFLEQNPQVAPTPWHPKIPLFLNSALTQRVLIEDKPFHGCVPAGHSVDPGSAGLLGRRGPRSKQPFMVTFFRASPSPARFTRAAKPPRRRQPKKSNDLPHPNKLPGIFGKVFLVFFVLEPYGKHEAA